VRIQHNKNIFDIKTKVDKEIEQNIIRADNQQDGSEEGNQRQKQRFDELHHDFSSHDRYYTRKIDKRLEEVPENKQYLLEMISKQMNDNIHIKENPHTLLKKDRNAKQVEEKVQAILIKQMERSKV